MFKRTMVLGILLSVAMCISFMPAAGLAAEYNVTSGLSLGAVLQVSGNPIDLVWQEVGTDTTISGDTVVSGYFYADPEDFAYGSQYNPEVFVKVYIASNGWMNIAFNHVTVDPVSVSSTNSGSHQEGTITTSDRIAEHTYDPNNGGSGTTTNFDGDWNGFAKSSISYSNGTSCGSSTAYMAVSDNAVTGSILTSWGETYSLTGTVTDDGSLSCSGKEGDYVVVTIQGTLSGASGSGTWEDFYGCYGTWTATKSN